MDDIIVSSFASERAREILNHHGWKVDVSNNSTTEVNFEGGMGWKFWFYYNIQEDIFYSPWIGYAVNFPCLLREFRKLHLRRFCPKYWKIFGFYKVYFHPMKIYKTKHDQHSTSSCQCNV